MKPFNLSLLVFFVSVLLFCACKEKGKDYNGIYILDVEGLKNVTSGQLEIVGQEGDVFGKIQFDGKRKRVFEVGLKEIKGDSLFFILPGGGGYLNLATGQPLWSGKFKYFGLKADLTAQKTGPPSKEMLDLTSLKPIGPGVISTEQEESFPSFDSFNNTLFFTRDQRLYSSIMVKGNWEAPVRLDFSNEFNDSAPYVYNEGNSLLFTSNRPLPNSSKTKKNLWTTTKSNTGWNEPVPLDSPINIDSLGDYHGAAMNDSLFYFISYNREGGYGRSDIYKASIDEEGSYEVLNLGPAINSEKSEADVFVGKDERYLLFATTGREDGYGADDIYISYRKEDGWSAPENLGPKVNSFAYEYGAWVDADEGYIYFNSYRRGKSDLYRVELGDGVIGN